MASEVDICNLALGHLGDNATVASINPPEGSAQAEHCQRFYPIARDSLLEMNSWNFTMRRAELASVAQNWSEWKYAYVLPSDCLNPISILEKDAYDDYSSRFYRGEASSAVPGTSPLNAAGEYSPKTYSIETTVGGAVLLFTNTENAVLRYSAYVTDTTSFSPMFVMTLSWHLASMLAGPIVKGDMGAAEGKRCVTMMGGYLTKALSVDANSRKIQLDHIVPWTAGR